MIPISLPEFLEFFSIFAVTSQVWELWLEWCGALRTRCHWADYLFSLSWNCYRRTGITDPKQTRAERTGFHNHPVQMDLHRTTSALNTRIKLNKNSLSCCVEWSVLYVIIWNKYLIETTCLQKMFAEINNQQINY